MNSLKIHESRIRALYHQQTTLPTLVYSLWNVAEIIKSCQNTFNLSQKDNTDENTFMENEALALGLKDSTSSSHLTEWIVAQSYKWMDLFSLPPGISLKILTFSDKSAISKCLAVISGCREYRTRPLWRKFFVDKLEKHMFLQSPPSRKYVKLHSHESNRVT